EGHALAGEDARGVLLAILDGAAVADEGDGAGAERDSADGESCAAASDRGQDASPVRIAAMQRSLHQGRRGDGMRSQPGIAFAARAAYLQLHHSCCPFAIADDHPRQLTTNRVE